MGVGFPRRRGIFQSASSDVWRAALQDENDERRRIRRNPGAINRLEIFVDVFRGEERRKKMCRIKRLLDFYTLVLDLELDSSLSRSEVKREMILFLVRGIR